MVTIKTALKNVGCPVERPPYNFKPDTKAFFTYQVVLEEGVLFTEDDNDEDRILYSVDLYCRGDWRQLVKKAKGMLKEAGYDVGDIGPEMYEKDTGFTHIPISVEQSIGANENGDN